MPPPICCEKSSKELVEDEGVTPLAAGYVMSRPPPIGCEVSNEELVEDDGVTPLAGGHVLSCLRLLDVKNPTKHLWKTTVSCHWPEDMLCHASAYWM